MDKTDFSSESFSDLSSKYETSPHISPKSPSFSPYSSSDCTGGVTENGLYIHENYQREDIDTEKYNAKNYDSGDERDEREFSIDDYVTIGTHDGRFHVDEVLACVIAKIMYDDKIIITRSRDQEILDTCHILFDVGGEYNPRKFKFDHHQKNCNETFDGASHIPLSSAGMAWKFFGKPIIQSLLKKHFVHRKVDSKFVERMYSEIYYEYILEIDANDNGISRLKDEVDAETTENYDFHFNLPNIVSNYNNTANVKNEEEQLKAFNDAMKVVGEIFLKACIHSIDNGLIFWEDYDKFVSEYDEPNKLPSIINVSKYFKTYERILNQYDPQREFVKFVYFNPRSLSNKDTINCGEWTVKTRTMPGKSFLNVVDLASEDELKKYLKAMDSEFMSADDLVFLHKNLFLAKCKNEHAALAVAKYSLKKHQSALDETKRKSDSLTEKVSVLTKKLTTEKISPKQSLLVAGGALIVGVLIGKFLN
jgi:uncharacterized UPF0160 family protein